MTIPPPTNGDTGTSPAPFSDFYFEIGGEDQLAELRTKFPTQPENQESQEKLNGSLQGLLADIQIQTGALLKTDSISFLFGSGASKNCGGVLIGSVPIEIETDLLEQGVIGDTNPKVRKWLIHFYVAASQINPNDRNIPITRDQIIERREKLKTDEPDPLAVNYESVLWLLHRWRAAMPVEGGRVRIGDSPKIDLKSAQLDECLNHTTRTLALRCQLPIQGKEAGLEVYKMFVRKILTRPLNLKRTNIFTLNYDTLVEQAADAEGVVLIDGFVGTLRRVFRPDCYDQDLYFPAETTEGRVHRHERVAHLYKLHGSITWVASKTDLDNPYGLLAKSRMAGHDEAVIVYPTPVKIGETLGMPYAELFRRFAAAVVRPQSTLFVVGYGFGDDHVNSIILQALAIPSLTLVIVDPHPRSDFVHTLREQKDRRVWIFSGQQLGDFPRFVQAALPDLRDEEVRRKVIATHRALGMTTSDSQEELPRG